MNNIPYQTSQQMYSIWNQAHGGDTAKTFVSQGWATSVGQSHFGGHGGDNLNEHGLYSVFLTHLEHSLLGYHADYTDLGEGDDWNYIGTAMRPFISFHLSGNAGAGGLAGEGGIKTEPWTFGTQTQDIVRKWHGFHYRMIPYLFTYAMMAHETGMPVWRHMMSHDPQNPDTWNKDMQAYVGEEFIVSPYYGDYPGNTGTVRKGIWLPAGTWYDYFEGTKYAGPTTIDYTVDPGTGSLHLKLPLFVKAGSIIPTMDTMQFVGEKPETTLTLGVWPSGSSQFTLYEDEKPTKTIFRCVNTASQTDVVIGPFAGSAYCADASKRRYAIELHGATAPQAVMSSGSALTKQASKAMLDAAASGWFFDAAKGGVTFVKSSGNASTGFTVSFCSSGQCTPVQSVRHLAPQEVAGTVRLISRRRIDVPYNGTYRLVVFDTNGAIVKTLSGSGPSQVRLPASRGMSIVKVTTVRGETTLRVPGR